MKSTLPMIAAAAVFSLASTNAAIIADANNGTFSTTDVNLGGSATHTFAGFNSALGTLTDVTIVFSAKQRADVTVTYNGSEGPIDAKVTLTSTANTLTFSDPSVTVASVTLPALEQTLSVNNGDGAVSFPVISTGTATLSDTVNSTDLAYFTDNSASASISTSGVVSGPLGGDFVNTLDSYIGEGNVTILYTYTTVPEPSSALLGLLGAGFLVIRRKRA